ncbi:MAG: glutamate racemase [Candidatus Paceibacterota bacterium]
MNDKGNQSIGVFDSGFGGLSILKGIIKKLPQYDYVYLGDNEHSPYGDKTQETILKFTKQAIDFLFKKNCNIVILACNTASSKALREIQQNYLPKHYPNKKVLGVLIPGAEEAVSKKGIKRIAVFATEATVSTGSFKREILKLDPKLKVTEIACPLLVPIVEEGRHNSKDADEAIKKYIKLLPKKVDALILGCTHYGILKNKIKKYLPKDVKIISEEDVVPKNLKNYLNKHLELESKLSKKSQRVFYSTDEVDKFETLGSKFFGQKIKVKKANLLGGKSSSRELNCENLKQFKDGGKCSESGSQNFSTEKYL